MWGTSNYSSYPSLNLKKQRAKRGRPKKSILQDYTIESKNIKGLKIDNDIFLCLNQFAERILKHIPLNVIHEACFILDLKYQKSSDSIKKLMKAANALHHEEDECNLIKIKDAERLCNFFLQKETSRTSRLHPFFDTVAHAFHDYFGGCEGIYVFDMDVEPRSRCIQCNQCLLILSAQRFLCHTHVLGVEKKDLPPDPLVWENLVFIRGKERTYPLSCIRKCVREVFSGNPIDLCNLSNQHLHCMSEQNSSTIKSDQISKSTSNFPYNVNSLSSASTKATSTKQKSSKNTSEKLRKRKNIKSPEMLHNVFSPEVVQPSSVEKVFNQFVSQNSPTTLKSFDFSTTTNKPVNLSTANIESLNYANTQNELFVFSASKTEAIDLSVSKAKPIDFSINKAKSVCFSDTKAKSLDFSAIETQPLDLSTSKTKQSDFSSTTEAVYSLLKLLYQ